MLGSIIGDIVGSIYEFDNIKTKEFPFFNDIKEYTDDSILTIATAEWLLDGCEKSAGTYYLRYAQTIPTPWGPTAQASAPGWHVLLEAKLPPMTVAETVRPCA